MAYNIIQSAGVLDGGVTGNNGVAFGSNLSAGTKLIAYVSCFDAAATAVKDTAGNAFTKVATNGPQNSDVWGQLWILDTPSGDVGTTPTITATTTEYAGLIIMEVSGLKAGNSVAVLDGSPGYSGGTQTGTITSPSYTSTAAHELLLTMFNCGNNSHTIINATGSETYNIVDKLDGSVGGSGTTSLAVASADSGNKAETSTWSIATGTPDWTCILVAFQLAPASSVAPFTAQRLGRGAAAVTGRGRGAGHQGARYVFFPSKFQLPRRPARGAAEAARGRTEQVTGKRTQPAPPSPFTLPVRPARGASAIRGRGAGHQGAAYVAFPSPFQLPRRPARGAPAIARGRGGGRLGLYVTPPPPPATSPFTLPRRPARGAAIARAGRGWAGSATGRGAPVVPRRLIIALASKAGTDDYGNTFPQGILANAGIIAGPEFLVYNGAPAAGTLATSSVESAGPDAYGNAVLAGVSTYNQAAPGAWVATNLSDGQLSVYTATSSAGPWTLQGSLGWDFNNSALEINSALEVNGTSSFNSGATFESGITVGNGVSGANVNLSPPMGVISGYPFATGSFTSALAAGVNQLIGEMVNRGLIS